MSNIVDARRMWTHEGASGLFPGDEVLLDAVDKPSHIRSGESFVASEEWAGKTDRIHLGLLPAPYVGSLVTARVFVLMSNPGFSPLGLPQNFGHRV